MRFIVTGASSGIGFAVADSLAIRKHHVIAVARSTDRLEVLKDRYGDFVQVLPADLSTSSGLHRVVEAAKAAGRVDGIVHSAGSIVTPAAYRDLEANSIVADLGIHVTAPISLNNALQAELAGGRILYIDSYSASSLRVGWSGYSIVKAAAQMAARAAAEEIPDANVIRVYPGAVRTALVDTLLASGQRSPTHDMFSEMDSNGTIVDPAIIGDFIADILLNATMQQLEAREIWDFNNPDDRVF